VNLLAITCLDQKMSSSVSASGSDSEAMAPPKFDLSASSDGSSSASPEPVKKTKKAATASDSDDDSSSQRESVKQSTAKKAKKAKKATAKKTETKQKTARAKTKRSRRGGGRLPAKLQVAQTLNDDAFEQAVGLLADPETFKKQLDVLAKTEAACVIEMCYKSDNRDYTTEVAAGVFEPFGPFLPRQIVVNELVKRINTYLVKRTPVKDKKTGEPRQNDDGSLVTRPVVNYFSKVSSFENGVLHLEVS
jgi:hypothetical protein